MTDTIKHMWDQVEKARADGTFSSPAPPITPREGLEVKQSPGMNEREGVVALLDKHVDGVRHYLHLQIGKPLSRDLISSPEIALDNLHRELREALRAPAPSAPNPVMWVCLVPNPLGELRIRVWTADRKRMESLRAEGLDMQALYAALPSSDRGGVGVHRTIESADAPIGHQKARDAAP